MGILLEADYKGAISGKESPIAGLQKVFARARDRGVNPLETKESEDLAAADPRDQLSYEVMNRDSAILLARHAALENVGTFVYVSAVAGAPILPARYISTKREAERAIASNFPAMRSIFFRPPFLYDSSRAVTIPLAAMVGAGTIFNGLTGGVLRGFIGAGGVKPLKADVVAEAIVEALGDETVSGPVEPPAIEELANRAWRKTML
jgi:uncharacterized protein YbjT (DUF2867 family)